MYILLVEDDYDTAQFIKKKMEQEGHQIKLADNGDDGLRLALIEHFDVLVLDRMLPKRDGLSIIKALRQLNIMTPILILSALGDVDHRIEGLREGGDDYLVKPYDFSELLARLKALLRRTSSKPEETILQAYDLKMNLLTRKVTRSGQNIDLLAREFTVLELLLKNAGEVITHKMLLEKVWNYDFDPQTNVIQVQINRLRKKIDNDFDMPLIHTIRGIGYILCDPETL